MPYKNFVSWLLTGSITILIIVLGYFGSESLEELKKIRGEITELNIKMVVIVGNQNNFQLQLDQLNKRIEKIEMSRP